MDGTWTWTWARRISFSFSLDIYWLVWDFSYGSVRDTYGLGYVGGDEDGVIKLTLVEL